MSERFNITYEEITSLQEELIVAFHRNSNENNAAGGVDFLRAIRDNTMSNFNLWHLEDKVRRIDIADSEIVELKREIDKENQKRNNGIERIDEILISILPQLTEDEKKELPMNSETPGSIIDRLSIGNLKVYHMNEQIMRKEVSIEHIENCKNKLNILKLQKRDLSVAFDQLMQDLFNRKKQLQIYRQFKMYNDSRLNPAIYEKNN